MHKFFILYQFFTRLLGLSEPGRFKVLTDVASGRLTLKEAQEVAMREKKWNK